MVNSIKIIWSLIGLVILVSFGGFIWAYIQENSPSEAELMSEAESFYAEGNLAEAKQRLDKIENLDGNGKVLLAETLKESDPQQSILILNQLTGVDLTPVFLKRAVMLALVLEKGELAESLLSGYSPVLRLHPQVAFAQANVVLYQNKDANVAKQLLLSVLEKEPDHLEAKKLLIGLLLRSDSIVELSMAKSVARDLGDDMESIQLIGQAIGRNYFNMFKGEIFSWAALLEDHPEFQNWLKASDIAELRSLSSSLMRNGELQVSHRINKVRLEKNEASDVDRLAYFTSALRSNLLEDAESILSKVEDDLKDLPGAGDFLSGIVAMKKGETSTAILQFKKGAKSLTSGQSFIRTIETLRTFSPLSETIEIEVAKMALEFDDLPGFAAREYAKILLESIGIDREYFIDRVLYLSREENTLLIPWLIRNNEEKRALLLSRDLIKSGENEIIPIYFELLIEKGEVEEAKLLLSKNSSKMDAFVLSLLQLRLSEVSESRDIYLNQLDELWKRAIDLKNISEITALSRIILTGDDNEKKMSAFDNLIENGIPVPKETFFNLSIEQLRLGKTDKAYDVMINACVYYPQDPDFINNKNYLKVLLHGPDDAVIDEMLKLVEKTNHNQFYSMTLAAAYLLSDLPREALSTLEKLNFDLDDLPDNSAAIYASVLVANGRDVLAKKIYSTIDSQSLLEEEKRNFLIYFDEYF
jgi:hypothetical protein